MHRCLEIAAGGLGKTKANPLVGAVIVHNDRIIGEGYHAKFGGPHAEVVAIDSVEDKSLLKNSCLYVNLEPCCHYGKTPPCTLKILESEIPRVVIGNKDPNPLVSGKGIDMLKHGGIKVKSEILKEKCSYLNRRFFTYVKKERPYVILKWAKSLDGYIDNRQNPDENGQRTIITGKRSQILVHKWRSEEMGIMIGAHTANMDNPSLNVRYWKGDDPLRILVERNTPVKKNTHIMKDGIHTVIYSNYPNKNLPHVEYVYQDKDNFTLGFILNDLKNRGVVSLIIEGGSRLLNSFINQNVWDEARVFTGNIYLKRGLNAPSLCKSSISYLINEDKLEIMFNDSVVI